MGSFKPELRGKSAAKRGLADLRHQGRETSREDLIRLSLSSILIIVCLENKIILPSQQNAV